MARTAPPAAPPAATPDTTTAPAPAPAAAPTPPPAPSAWTTPHPDPVPPAAPDTPDTIADDTPAKARRTARGGLPVGPTLASAGNATALTLTTALHYTGPVGAATTGALVAAGMAATVLRKRATARRAMATRSGRTPATHGATGTGRGGSGGATKGATPRAWSATGAPSGAQRRGATGLMAPRHSTPRSGGATHSASGSRGATTSRHNAATPLLGGGRKNRRNLNSGAPVASGATTTPRPGAPRHTGATTHPSARHGTTTANSRERHHRTPGGAGRSTLKAALNRAARATGTTARLGGKLTATAGRLAGRGATTAWTATAPLRAAAARQLALAAVTASRLARRVPGALLDATLATGAGLLSALWRWNVRAGWRRLIDTWKRLRTRRSRKQKNTAPQPTTGPAVADFVRQPTHPTTTPTGGTLMTGGHHFLAPAMEMKRLAEAYEPTGMLQVGADFATLPEALQLHAEAMKATLEKADAYWPIDPAIVDLLGEIYALQARAADMARELAPAFRDLHSVDISRLEQPRKGAQAEAMWDVTRNI
ncbi:hypothetical protein [Streptomyces sp. NPDC101145]|uniref:hypothetical protein n=1 Tax=Streptomyces sp. NPDC101145 TaxID=3366112 RepID=UPI00380BEDA2